MIVGAHLSTFFLGNVLIIQSDFLESENKQRASENLRVCAQLTRRIKVCSLLLEYEVFLRLMLVLPANF